MIQNYTATLLCAQGVYKKSMAPLAVYLIDDTNGMDKANKFSESLPYHKLFILSKSNLNKKINNNKVQIIVFDFKSFDLKTLCKLIIAHTNEVYTHYIIYYNCNENFINDLELFNEYEIYKNDELILFTKNYFIFNDIEFNFAFTEDIDSIEHYELLDKAINGELVNKKYFNEGLKELLPECKYFIKIQDLDFELANIINSKNVQSNTEFYILNEKSEEINNQIVFTSSDLNNYKFVIRRDDGLNCYIF